MKRECPSLFAALLVSLLVNRAAAQPDSLLARAPGFSVRWSVRRCWRRRLAVCLVLAAGRRPLFKLLFGALLVYTSVLELLRLWQLADRLYPGAVTLTDLSARCAACRLSAAGFGAVPDGLCRALSAGTGNRRHAGIGAFAAVHRRTCKLPHFDTGRFFSPPSRTS